METWERRNLFRALLRTLAAPQALSARMSLPRRSAEENDRTAGPSSSLLHPDNTAYLPPVTTSGSLSNWVVLNFALRVWTGPRLDAQFQHL